MYRGNSSYVQLKLQKVGQTSALEIDTLIAKILVYSNKYVL